MAKMSQLISLKSHMEIDEALKVFDEPGRIEPYIIMSNRQEDTDYNMENIHSITMGKAALILCKLLQAKCEEARSEGKDSLTLEDIEKTIQFVVVDHPGNIYYTQDEKVIHKSKDYKIILKKENNDTNNN